ncbi:antibiotic biosynthesis monooxygenase [Paraburkholderia sp. Ac-20340]|nr:putative quinol monooxygenase [Paraburkholderia sp. Ac-20340]MBN3853688.1 antibiotic biosynthesis monooxygenase [Paraburkholderia sp. Ac-20340]
MSNAKKYVVIAEFKLLPGKRETFLEAARADARDSMANESGCHTFDVLLTEGDENLVVFHEVYSDRSAYDWHRQTPHFETFRTAVAALLDGERKVRFFERH